MGQGEQRAARPAWPVGGGAMGARIRAFDWAATPLGPLAGWPAALRLAVGAILDAPFPQAVVWGPARITLYNDAFRPILGAKPEALGQPFDAIWREAWPTIGPLAARALAGEATFLADFPLTVERGGGPEAAFFTFAYSPLRDEAGAVAGFLDTVIETTGRVRAEAARRASEARQAFLLRLGEALRPLADPLAVQEVAMRLLGEHLALSRAFYLRAERDGSGWVHVVESDYHHAPGLPSVVGRHPLGAFGSAVFAGMEQGETIVVADVDALPILTPEERRSYAAFDLRAFVNVPLVKGGEYVAAACVHDAAPRAWTPAEIGLIQEVAERTWAAVERARAEAARQASEVKYRALFASMDEAYAVVEVLADDAGRWRDFRFLEVNPAFMTHTGMTDPAGRTATELLGTPNPRWAETYGRVAETGEPVRFEGSELTLGRAFDLNVFRLGGPGSRRVAVLFTNVTARRAAEAALRESEARFRQFGDASSAVLWIRDAATLRFEYLSPAFAALYGADPADVDRGDDLARWAALIHPEDRGRALANLARVRAGERVTHAFRVVRPADGAERWVSNTDFPLRDAAGRVVRLGGIAEDVTAPKAAAAAAARAREEAIATVSHELRTPLAALRGGLGLLEASAAARLRDDERALLANARRNVARLAQQVDDLVAFNRLRAGALALERAPLDLRLVAADAAGAVAPLLHDRGQALAFDLPDPLPAVGDAACLGQVLTNLLGNAHRHTPPGTRVTLAGWAAGGEVVLTVADDGPGLPPGDPERLFARGHSGGAGWGLGLAIARELVALHGGRLWAERPPGGGAAFHLALPRADPPAGGGADRGAAPRARARRRRPGAAGGQGG